MTRGNNISGVIPVASTLRNVGLLEANNSSNENRNLGSAVDVEEEKRGGTRGGKGG